MSYRIEFSPKADRLFRKLPADVRRRLGQKIDALADNPRPPGATKLQGPDEFYRIRSGDYRVIYLIRDDRLLVLVIKVGHRRDIYRDF